MASAPGPPSKRRKLNPAEDNLPNKQKEKQHDKSQNEEDEYSHDEGGQSHPEDLEAAAVLALAKQSDQYAASHEATLTARTERGQILEYVVTMLNKCDRNEQQHAPNAQATRLALYKNIIRLLTLPVMAHDPLTDKLSQVLLAHMPSIEEKGRGYLMEVLLHNLESSSAIHPILLELLPRLLDLTAASHRGPSNSIVWIVPQAGLGGASVRSVAASIYRTSVIQRVCELDWEQRVGLTLSEENDASQAPQAQSTSVLLLHILRCFKQLEMTSEEHSLVIKTAVKSLKSTVRAVPLVEAPAVFHSLLALSGQGEKPRILKALLDYFESAEAEVTAEEEQQSQWGSAEQTIALRAAALTPLLQAEGTTLLHASLTFSRDLKWSKVIERFYMSNLPPAGGATFRWALLLAAARSLHSGLHSQVHLSVQRSGQVLYDLLRKLVAAAIQQNWQPHRANSSDFSPNGAVGTVPILVDVGWEAHSWPALTKALLLCVDRANEGSWDTVLESLVEFAGQMLNIVPADWIKRTMVQWGSQLACRLFTHAEQTRPAILDAILTNFIAQSQSDQAYMNVLAAIVQQSAHSVLLLEDKLREAMSYCSVLPQPSLVAAFVRAIAPLLTLRPSLRDQLLLILRKALFSRAEETRRVACSALTTLLCCNKHSPFDEQHALEVVDLLKRCLTQQAEVRMQLYEDAQRYLVFSRRAHSQSTKHLADLLETHLLNRYLHSMENDAAPCVDLDACFDSRQVNVSWLQEPLPLLLRTLISLASVYQDLRVRQTLLRLSQRLSKSELEQFELDKTSDFDPQTIDGQRNHRRAGLLLQVTEVCMEATARLTDLKAPNSIYPATILSLSKFYTQLKATVKEGTPKQNAKPNKPKTLDEEGLDAESDGEDGSHGEEGSVLTQFAKKKAKAVATPSTISEEGVQSLLGWLLPQPVPAMDISLTQHILQCTCSSLKAVNRVVAKDPAQWVLWEMQSTTSRGDAELEKRPTEEPDICIYQTLAWLPFCQHQAPDLWKEFFAGWESAREAPAGGRLPSFSKSVQTLSLDCFFESIKLFLSWASSRSDRDLLTAKFFQFSLAHARSNDFSARPVHSFMNEVWRLIPLVAEQNMMHECEQLIDILGMLHPLLTEQQLEEHVTNATAFTMSENPNPIFARRAMRLFWTMQLRGDETLDCLRQFAEQLKILWGDSTMDVNTASSALPATPEFTIITDRTAPALFSELLSMLDQQVDQITTLLTSLRRRQSENSETPAINNEEVSPKSTRTNRKASSKSVTAENVQMDDEVDIDQESAEESNSSAFRHRICSRSLGISGCLEIMLFTAVKPPGVDGLFKVVLRFYRLLDLLAKDLLSLKKRPPEVFDRLVSRVGGYLSPRVGSFILYVNNQLSGVASGTTDETLWVKFAPKGGKKVASVVPKITEAIERFETVDLAAMETKLPDVKYRHLLKRSAARDFKIKVKELAEMQPISRKPSSKQAL